MTAKRILEIIEEEQKRSEENAERFSNRWMEAVKAHDRKQRMKRIYIVTFEIHRDCQIQQLVYYCEAQNAKDACEIAKATWRHKSHMFHVHAVKSRIQAIDAISIKSWQGNEYKGQNALNKHIMLDFYTWRVNGKSVFC